MSDKGKRAQPSQNRKIALFLFAAIAFCMPVQFFLGADVTTLVLDISAISIGLFFFQRLSFYSPGAWFIFFYIFGNILFAFLIKTIFLQTIDSNLYAPEESYLVELIAVLALVVAVILVSKINVGRPLLSPELSTAELRVLTWGCLLIGTVSWHFSGVLSGDEASEVGGFGAFQQLTYMAVICKTAMLLGKENSKRLWDIELIIILLVNLFFGAVANSQAAFATPVICYFATLLFFRGSIPLLYIAFSILFGLIFTNFIAPLIHVLRFLGEEQASFSQRIDLVLLAISDIVNGGVVARLAQNSSQLITSGYYNYFGNVSAGEFVFGRFASIQQIDPVIARASQDGSVGLPIIGAAFHAILPKVIDPTKLPFDIGFYVLLHYGFVSEIGGKFPTLPMMGELFAEYGLPGAFILGFALFFSCLLILKKITWSLKRNVFAIFFFSNFITFFVSQGAVEQYVGFTFRGMPSYAIVFFLLKYAGRITFSRSSASGTHLFSRR